MTGAALYIPLKLLDQLVFDTTRTFGLMLLTGHLRGPGCHHVLFSVVGIRSLSGVRGAQGNEENPGAQGILLRAGAGSGERRGIG